VHRIRKAFRGSFFPDSAIRKPQIAKEKKSLMDGKKSADRFMQVSTKLASSGIAVPADASITRATVRSSFSHSRECFYLISR
jgi:hypothetical protein